MKTHIPVCVALAVAFLATTAYGQYVQQHQQPQQSWGAPGVHSNRMQQASMQQPAMQQPAVPQPVMQNTYTPVVGQDCGDQCGSNCGVQCGSDCGGRCGRGLRSRGGLLAGQLGGLGGQLGTNDPCCSSRYVSIFGGAATFNDIGLGIGITDPAGATQDISAILEQNDGWTIGGSIGRSIGRRLRGEVEFSYRNASLNSADLVLNGVSQGNAALDGQHNIYRSTSNLLFDVNPGGRFNAYFGGGVGVGFVDVDATEPTTPISARFQSSTWVYQGIVGVSGKINPRAELFVDYRYFGTDQLEIDAVSPIGSASVNLDMTANDIFVGLRIKR